MAAGLGSGSTPSLFSVRGDSVFPRWDSCTNLNRASGEEQNRERRLPKNSRLHTVSKYDQAALVEIEDALVPAFIIEELDDGSCTVFVPSAPTPMAGAVYILAASRVHKLDVPFTQVLKAVSHWGSGSKDLVAAMEGWGTPSLRTR
jgi:hypothetical protein